MSEFKTDRQGAKIRTYEFSKMYVNIAEVQCIESSTDQSCYIHLKSGDYYEVIGDSVTVMESMREAFGDGTRLAFYGAEAIVSHFDRDVRAEKE